MGVDDPFLNGAATSSNMAILPSSSGGVVYSKPPAIDSDVVHSGPSIIHVSEAILPSSSSGTGPPAVHIPEVVLPLGWDLPSGSSSIVHSGLSAVHIPEVVLPSGWDAPLRHLIPVNIPPAPMLPQGRGRGHSRRRIQPVHAINSNVSNPAVDGLHCGQIALRERERNSRINQLAAQSEEINADRDMQRPEDEQGSADQRAQVAKAQEAFRQQQIHQTQANA